jgi:hypothetical protein
MAEWFGKWRQLIKVREGFCESDSHKLMTKMLDELAAIVGR